MGAPMPYPNQQPFRPAATFYTMDGAHQQHQMNVDQDLPPAQIAPWNHTVPLCVPWFQTDSPFPSTAAESSSFNVHCKRKSLHLDEEMPVTIKQFISEEAMALRMTQLQISNNSSDDQMIPVFDLEKSDCGVSEGLVDFDPRQRQPGQPPSSVVVLSPELKKLEAEPILPKSILNRLQKPTMELVIWKPPAGIIDEVIRATLSGKDADQKKASAAEGESTNEYNMDEDTKGKQGSSSMDII